MESYIDRAIQDTCSCDVSQVNTRYGNHPNAIVPIRHSVSTNTVAIQSMTLTLSDLHKDLNYCFCNVAYAYKEDCRQAGVDVDMEESLCSKSFHQNAFKTEGISYKSKEKGLIRGIREFCYENDVGI